MIMIHGDNKGLVMPPRVAPVQIVLVPLFFKNKDNSELKKKAAEIVNDLQSQGFRFVSESV
jgi:prolyl-tRNA synthetase